jgi:hypothetical protein
MEDIIGTVDQVRAHLEALHASGDLVSLSPPRPAGTGLVRVRVEVRALVKPTTTRPRQTPTRPRQGWQVPAAVIGGALAAVGALVALLWWVVLWLADHAAQVVGVLGALLFVLWLLGRAGACPGFHCPGCRHR